MFFCCELTVIHTKFSWKQLFCLCHRHRCYYRTRRLFICPFVSDDAYYHLVGSLAYSQSSGYQTVQSYIAVGSGGVFGQGMGTGISKFNYLPEAHTDFAFAVIAQEWGSSGPSPSCFCFAACCQSASKRPSAAETVSGPSWRWALPFHSAVRDSSTWPWSRALSLSSACPCLLSAMADLAHLEYHSVAFLLRISMIISVKPKRAWLTSSRSRSKR